jgi:hypothetical protein
MNRLAFFEFGFTAAQLSLFFDSIGPQSKNIRHVWFCFPSYECDANYDYIVQQAELQRYQEARARTSIKTMELFINRFQFDCFTYKCLNPRYLMAIDIAIRALRGTENVVLTTKRDDHRRDCSWPSPEFYAEARKAWLANQRVAVAHITAFD